MPRVYQGSKRSQEPFFVLTNHTYVCIIRSYMKKNSSEWLEKEAALTKEGNELMAASDLLTECIKSIGEDIEKFDILYPNDEIHKLGWQEKEMVMDKMDQFQAELNIAASHLEKVDAQYEDLRKRANEFYNKEVLKEIPHIDILKEEDEYCPDEADWWKEV